MYCVAVADLYIIIIYIHIHGYIYYKGSYVSMLLLTCIFSWPIASGILYLKDKIASYCYNRKLSTYSS